MGDGPYMIGPFTAICAVCGIPLPLRPAGMPGRPSGFPTCSRACQQRWRYANDEDYRAAEIAKHARSRSKWTPEDRARLAAAKRAWRAANLDHVLEVERNRRDTDHRREYERVRGWRRHFGITPADYAALLESQGFGCAICGERTPGAKREYFHVDHDHATGQVRGLLCHHCNTALGGFRDSPERLRSAIDYLARNHPRLRLVSRHDAKETA